MNKSATLETTASEPDSVGRNVAQLKLSIAQCLTEIDQMREQMSRDQAEIDRSQKRTHALLMELKETVSKETVSKETMSKETMFPTGRQAA
jgi:molecular chaperone GrpE (heat shock protein)